MGSAGFGIVGAAAIFISLISVNTMNVYSATMSTLNTFPKLKFTTALVIIAITTTVAALFVGLLTGLIGFLDTVGAFYLPIYSIIIADYFVLRKRKYNATELVQPTEDSPYGYFKGVNILALVVYACGALLTYNWGSLFPTPLGTTLPGLVTTFIVYIIVNKIFSIAKKN